MLNSANVLPVTRIPARWRLLLLLKLALLLAVAAGFGALGMGQLRAGDWFVPRAAFAGLMFFLAAFLVWAAAKAARDVISGEAVTESGVEPLKNRRSGYSMKTPSGRFVEFILWNSWEPLEQGARYTVTYGRSSGVIISRPVRG